MKELSHSVFMIFLMVIGLSATISLAGKGLNYYLTPMEQRPFRTDYATMKPSGTYSHGLGIIGSLMIIVGVATYSTRKRYRALWNLGKLSRWLEFHIFLCLVGPIMIIYHTTFKAGGIASISLWTMLSVVASGVIGRYLYVQIPRNLKGAELTEEEIQNELGKLGSDLESTALGTTVVKIIDDGFARVSRPRTLSETLSTIMQLEAIKRQTRRQIHELIRRAELSHSVAKQLHRSATTRASLIQKSAVLGQVQRLFFYWHAIHLPFSIIMFITLGLHVTVSILLGYTWIF